MWSCISAREWVSGVARPDLTIDLRRSLEQYAGDVAEKVDEVVEHTSREALQRVKAASPVRTGRYRKAWRIKIDRKSGRVSATIYNAGEMQLTHLLEHGHRTRLKSGKYGDKAYAAPRPHIEPVQDWLNAEAEKEIEEVLRK